MSTRNLAQQTNGFIQRQHDIFQRFYAVQAIYEKEKKEAEARYNHEKADAEAAWKQAQSNADAELGQIRQVLVSAQTVIAGSPWQGKEIGGTSQALIATSGIDSNQEIARCRSTAFEAQQEITRFLQFNQEPGSVTKRWGWLAVILAIVTCSICSILSQAAANSGGSGGLVILGLLIAIGGGIALFGAMVSNENSKLKNSYATLASAVSAAENLFRQRLRPSQDLYQRQLNAAEDTYKGFIRQAEQTLSRNVDALLPAFVSFNNAVHERSFLGVDWNDASWERWQPFKTTTPSPIARLGTLTIESQRKLPSIPAFVACPGNQNMLFEASGDGKDHASAAIQAIMLRLLATLPPGKVHFTLIDPVGLGKNVEIFMQLADEEYDKRLVNSRAWTDQRQIEQRLTDLSEEIVNIGQKYLRGQFKTIEDYNKQAGEVEEPYRVLVVIGFPDRFTEDTAKSLVKIAENGPKCGVSTLVMMDTEMPKPYGFNLDDLKRVSTVFTWNGPRFVWRDPDFEDSLLKLDTPPKLERFNHILHEIGAGSKIASEVKVPFERIAPPEEKWWDNQEWWRDNQRRRDDSLRDGISVPLGRAGATKLQLLELGKQNSTAHHALIAGKTGSGKTTLLHVLITNLALTYSPDEIELYLVDFKTVGFTPYATYKLPHIRVVAIQSEREFGLSVLRKLDDELVRRKNLFSKMGVADINQYRKGQPNEHMPRILLLVDEFQEFFTEDDEIARSAGVFLERLVRQGRGLGIHIMLGSQSLSGTSSLPLATLGQMDIRIAMRCEERDARLILSDDNPAARLLSRPGEAIYNAANGLEAGNNKFQCAWLSDDELKNYLQHIQRFAQRPEKRGYMLREDAIVFDGNAYADVADNKLLKKVLEASSWPIPQRAISAWLGDPITIKEPTAIQIRPQAGNNLLIVGQQEEIALGMLVSTMLSQAAQHAPQAASFYVVDFSPADAPYAGLLERVGALLPHKVKVVNRRNLLSVITEVADVVQDRMETEEGQKPSIYLLIYGLQRARDLRQTEDLSFSSFGSGDSSGQPNPAKQFATILREGPELNVHTLTWCDTLTNLNRTLERGALREFEMRAVFQMSSDDSMSLIDLPTASKLGPYRALLYSEETGRAEKFRPYRLPEDDWLQKVADLIRQKR